MKYHNPTGSTLTPKFIIRADSYKEIGTGHIVRCLALAEQFKVSGGDVTFVSHCESDFLIDQILSVGCEFIPLTCTFPNQIDLQTTLSVIKNSSEAKYHYIWTILDGYQFDSEYQQKIMQSDCDLMVIDDSAHQGYYHTNVLLNQNLGANNIDYVCDPHTTMLLGSKYTLLRSQFTREKIRTRFIPKTATKILVTMGGSDKYNLTSKIIQSIQNIPANKLEVLAVVGTSNSNFNDIQETAKVSQVPVKIVRETDEMPDLMTWADLAISAAGSTTWELSFMGTPMILVVTEDNQISIADQMTKFEAAHAIESRPQLDLKELLNKVSYLISNSNERERMSERCWNLVDGDGCKRVIDNLAIVQASDRSEI